MNRTKNSDRRFVFGMLSPTLFVFVTGIMFPLLYGIFLSLFYTDQIRHINTFVGLGNYRQLLLGSLSTEFYAAYYTTVFFTVVTVSIELILGLGIALLINKEFKGRGIIRAAVLVPWAMPTIVNAQLWSYMFRGDQYGLVNNILENIGFIPKGSQPLLFTTGSSILYVNYIFLLSVIGFFLLGFILLYNLGKSLYNGKFNEFVRTKLFIILLIGTIIGFFFGFIVPIVFGVDKAYGYAGDTLLGNHLSPFSLPVLLAIIFLLLFAYFAYKAVKYYLENAKEKSAKQVILNGEFLRKAILALFFLFVAVMLPVQFGNSIPVDLTTRYPTTLFIILMVDIWKTTPFMALLILASLQVIPQDLYKAASVDGATSYQQFRQITLPLITPGIGTALIFRCIDAFRVYDIIAVFNVSSTYSISYLAYQEQNVSRHTGTAATIAVITFINIVIFTIFFFYLTRRRYDT